MGKNQTLSQQEGLKAGLIPDRLCHSHLLSFGPFDFQRESETVSLCTHSPPPEKSFKSSASPCQGTVKEGCKILILPGSGCVQVVSWTQWFFHLFFVTMSAVGSFQQAFKDREEIFLTPTWTWVRKKKIILHMHLYFI